MNFVLQSNTEMEIGVLVHLVLLSSTFLKEFATGTLGLYPGAFIPGGF